jgi:hypothetical protein
MSTATRPLPDVWPVVGGTPTAHHAVRLATACPSDTWSLPATSRPVITTCTTADETPAYVSQARPTLLP